MKEERPELQRDHLMRGKAMAPDEDEMEEGERKQWNAGRGVD